jgi:hypothetical protein
MATRNSLLSGAIETADGNNDETAMLMLSVGTTQRVLHFGALVGTSHAASESATSEMIEAARRRAPALRGEPDGCTGW